MSKHKEEKTNVMRTLEQKKIAYTPHEYPADGPVDGVSVAAYLNQDPEQVFKTLVTKGAGGGYYVFDIPVAENLDLKKAAKAVGEKSIAPPEGAAAAHGLCPRRLLPGGHEKAVPHGVPRDGGAVRHHLRLRRKDRRAGGGGPGGPHCPVGGPDGGRYCGMNIKV